MNLIHFSFVFWCGKMNKTKSSFFEEFNFFEAKKCIEVKSCVYRKINDN